MFLHLSMTLFIGQTPPPKGRHLPRQTPPPPHETTTAADGTHPTGMYSCFNMLLISFVQTEISYFEVKYLLNILLRMRGAKLIVTLFTKDRNAIFPY